MKTREAIVGELLAELRYTLGGRERPELDDVAEAIVTAIEGMLERYDEKKADEERWRDVVDDPNW